MSTFIDFLSMQFCMAPSYPNHTRHLEINDRNERWQTWLTRSPKAKKPIAPCDDDIIQASGLAVVECSWARLDEVPFNRIKSPNERLCTFPSPRGPVGPLCQ